MNKVEKLLLVVFVSAVCVAHAQKDQDPDTLLWNGKKYLVQVDRAVPSVVQLFFQRNGADMPFQSWSSNNNRGHVATMELMNESLYLVNIEAKRYKTRTGNLWTETGIDTVVSPEFFGIKPLYEEQQFGEGPVKTDWFTGVLELKYIPADKKEKKSDEAKGRRLLHVMNGKVLENELITVDDEQKMNGRQSASPTVKKKMQLIDLQRRYINFYTRCALDREHVVMNGHEGLFEHCGNGMTLMMLFFGNDPMKWEKNWEKDWFDGGAPFGSWKIRNDSIFLEEVTTHSGEQLYGYESHKQFLPDLLADSTTSSGVVFGHRHQEPDGSYFADWLSGEYVIHYGEWITNNFGVPDYTVSKTQKIRVKNGIVLSSQFSPRSFEEDEKELQTATFELCNKDDVYSVDDKQLAENVGKYKSPKKAPAYRGGKEVMRNWFLRRPLTDERAKDRLFRVRIGFMVNCKGEAGQWQILNKGKGELFEFATMVMETVRLLPNNWEAAEDKKGNKVDCWQILEFTVSEGSLTSANYK